MGDQRKRLAVFMLPQQPHTDARPWQPQVDVYRAADGWLLKFDLAGIRPEDVLVRLEGRRITVSGVRRDYVLEAGLYYHSMEISYNQFERTVQLPVDVTAAVHQLEYRDGILLVRIKWEGKQSHE